MSGRFVADGKESKLSRAANDYARRFNTIATHHGFDLPMEVLIPLIELFGEAQLASLSSSGEAGHEASVSFEVREAITRELSEAFGAVGRPIEFIREVLQKHLASVEAGTAEQEGTCNPYGCTTCGAKFCTYEDLLQHSHTSGEAGTPEDPQ